MHAPKTAKALATIAPRSPYQTGRYSKLIPGTLRDRYELALADERLLSLRNAIALVDARVAELLEDFENTRPADFWEQLKKTWASFMYAVRANNAEEQVKLVRELDAMIGSGADGARLWEEVLSTLEQQRKLIESEQRRLTSLQQTITVEQAIALLGQMVSLVKRSVYDTVEPQLAQRVIDMVGIHYQQLLAVESMTEIVIEPSKGRAK